MAPQNNLLYALHDIEEYLRSLKGKASSSARLSYSDAVNRREKEILALAGRKNLRCDRISDEAFFRAAAVLGDPAPKGLRHILLELPSSALDHASAATDLKDILSGAESSSLILLLDGITDPHNLGAILRSANLFEVDAVVLPKRRSAQINDTVRRVSAGASHHTPVLYVPNLVRTIEEMKEAGYWVFAADLGGQRPDMQKLTGKTALIMGSEGSGPGREVLKHADGIITIPTGGQIDSFNVSVAAGILLYEIRRQAAFQYTQGSSS
jgi:23S rRNA (guanosine2251-2'-O)-methyltransferase